MFRCSSSLIGWRLCDRHAASLTHWSSFREERRLLVSRLHASIILKRPRGRVHYGTEGSDDRCCRRARIIEARGTRSYRETGTVMINKVWKFTSLSISLRQRRRILRDKIICSYVASINTLNRTGSLVFKVCSRYQDALLIAFSGSGAWRVSEGPDPAWF